MLLFETDNRYKKYKKMFSYEIPVTPVEEKEDVFFKRDDLYEVAGCKGGKVRTCFFLASEGGIKGLVTAGSRKSPQINIVAHIGKYLNLPVRAHTPCGILSDELLQAKALGCEIIQHKAGYNNVIIKRAKDDAKSTGYKEIPFGMECEDAVIQTMLQTKNIPFGKIKRIVIAAGSGMSLSGVLWGLKLLERKIPVLAIQVGADSTKRLEKFAPADWQSSVKILPSEYDYHEDAKETTYKGIRLDPIYEAKVIPFIEKEDLFWIIGVRNSKKGGE